MLLQFNFKNFKSFRDDTTLDLTATKISEYSNHVITIGNEKVLPIAAILGANASGKSNVLEAFRYMATYVANSLNYGGDESKKKGKSEFLSPTPMRIVRMLNPLLRSILFLQKRMEQNHITMDLQLIVLE